MSVLIFVSACQSISLFVDLRLSADVIWSSREPYIPYVVFWTAQSKNKKTAIFVHKKIGESLISFSFTAILFYELENEGPKGIQLILKC